MRQLVPKEVKECLVMWTNLEKNLIIWTNVEKFDSKNCIKITVKLIFINYSHCSHCRHGQKYCSTCYSKVV